MLFRSRANAEVLEKRLEPVGARRGKADLKYGPAMIRCSEVAFLIITAVDLAVLPGHVFEGHDVG